MCACASKSKHSTRAGEQAEQDPVWVGWCTGGGISCELEGESGEGTQSHSIAKRGPVRFDKTGKAGKKRGWQVVACNTQGISGRRVAERVPSRKERREENRQVLARVLCGGCDTSLL
jgi:hypothetical protein